MFGKLVHVDTVLGRVQGQSSRSQEESKNSVSTEMADCSRNADLNWKLLISMSQGKFMLLKSLMQP